MKVFVKNRQKLILILEKIIIYACMLFFFYTYFFLYTYKKLMRKLDESEFSIIKEKKLNLFVYIQNTN
jgi:hypothetical protein